MPAPLKISRASLEGKFRTELLSGAIEFEDGTTSKFTLSIQPDQGSDGDVSIAVTDGSSGKTKAVKLKRQRA